MNENDIQMTVKDLQNTHKFDRIERISKIRKTKHQNKFHKYDKPKPNNFAKKDFHKKFRVREIE